MQPIIFFFLLLSSSMSSPQLAQASSANFDVRQHLSTTSRYGAGKVVMEDFSYENTIPPAGCAPIHLNLVARHGTRAPTKKRIKQLNGFAERLKILVDSAPENPENVPDWMRGWQSPWKGRKVGGELIRQGEEEMFQLGERVRSRFSEIFQEDYHPEIYPISTTQVQRAAASAVAFGLGLFAGKGSLGPGLHRAFSVISDSRSNDIHLRFHETCQTYKESKEMRKPTVAGLQEEVYLQISRSLAEHLKLNITSNDVSSLWFLCKQEASQLDIVNQSCGLFTPDEVELLEWADDLELHHLKGYGESINYRMGVPLLKDVVQSMEEAILASGGAQNSVERARLRFAHAETITPFACLLGLFLDGIDIKIIQSEKPLDPPPKPPRQRLWRGNFVAPYGANTMLILHKCSSTQKEIIVSDDNFFVQVLHNEKPMKLQACNGTYFCPFRLFKDCIVSPHLRHSFESLCSVKDKTPYCSWICRLSRTGLQFLRWSKQTSSCEHESEL